MFQIDTKFHWLRTDTLSGLVCSLPVPKAEGTLIIQWMVVANRSQAQIFKRVYPPGTLKFLKKFTNPLAHEPERTFFEPAIKKASTKRKLGSWRVPTRREIPLHEVAAKEFAERLAKILNQDRIANRFQSLFIFAEPKFIGFIRLHMKPECSAIVESWIKDDLLNYESSNLESRLSREAKERDLFHVVNVP